MKQSIKIGLLILGLIACVSACIKLEATDAQAAGSSPEINPVPATRITTERVGMGIYVLTDNETGCQYISSKDGGIVPRMYSDGIQVCDVPQGN